jgi:hypothetical protein
MNANNIAALDLKYRGFFLKDELVTFSIIQMDICMDLVQCKSWKFVQQKYGIKSPNTIKRCILRTAGGYKWNHGADIGRKSVLSDADETKLVNALSERATDGNCVPTYEAIVIARNLMEGRAMRAEFLLNKFHCPKLLAKFEVYDTIFDLSHLTSLCARHNFRLSNAQTIEELRKQFCDYRDLDNFFTFITPHANSPPHLTFNADETTVASHSESKVITLRGKLPLKPDKKFSLHMTAMCCFNAIGTKVPLFIILKNLQSLPNELQELHLPIYYASSRSGWMTKELFSAWAVHFISWTATYRATYLHTYHPNDENAQILLYLDGHASRINYEAMKLFEQNNIKVITLRSHTTHLCQPFDKVIASPLKRFIKEYSAVWNRRYPQITHLSGTRLERAKAILCLYDAYEKAIDLANSESAFRNTGLVPLNRFIVLNNTNYVFNRPVPNVQVPQQQPQQQIPQQQPQVPQQPVQQQPAQQIQAQQPQVQQQQNVQNPVPGAAAAHIRARPNRFLIGERVLTERTSLADLLHHEYPWLPMPRIMPYVYYPMVKQRMLTNTVDKGKMLSNFMGYLVRHANGTMQYI